MILGLAGVTEGPTRPSVLPVRPMVNPDLGLCSLWACHLQINPLQDRASSRARASMLRNLREESHLIYILLNTPSRSPVMRRKGRRFWPHLLGPRW